MKLTTLVFAIVLYSSAYGLSAGTPLKSTVLVESKARATLPKLKFPNAAGQVASLLQGSHPHLLIFWAAWCQPCIEEVPDLKKILKPLRNKLKVVFVNLDKGSMHEAEAAGLMKSLMPGEIHLIPEAGFDPEKLGVTSIPTFLLTDSKGNVAANFYGTMKKRQKKFESLLLDLLKQEKLK